MFFKLITFFLVQSGVDENSYEYDPKRAIFDKFSL